MAIDWFNLRLSAAGSIVTPSMTLPYRFKLNGVYIRCRRFALSVFATALVPSVLLVVGLAMISFLQMHFRVKSDTYSDAPPHLRGRVAQPRSVWKALQAASDGSCPVVLRAMRTRG